MTSPLTTFPITPETQVPWPCWLKRGTEWKLAQDFEPIDADMLLFCGFTHYSTLPASQRPEEPTISGRVTQHTASGSAQASGSAPGASTSLGGDEHALETPKRRQSGDVTPLVRSDPVPAATAAQGLFLAEMIGGLQSARECCRMNMHGDGAAMVDMRLEQAIDIVTKHLGGDENMPANERPDYRRDLTPPPVSSDPTPGAQPLALALEAAARECVQKGLRSHEDITAILHRHIGQEWERLERENTKLKDERQRCDNSIVEACVLIPNVGAYCENLEKRLTRTQAALEEANRRVGELEHGRLTRDNIQATHERNISDLRAQLTALRTAAEQDREDLDWLNHKRVFFLGAYSANGQRHDWPDSFKDAINMNYQLRAAIAAARASEGRTSA